ncbi:hypothetical protein CYMTET_44118 [Cymbomonas tetramitiformis]|uniref:Uncharacterized protein n=1 Tax=Cymbomonas tetramitiformis TaxID=36881 RepID=A0AAE0C2X1_9CHLO|nr:hypothetical protein CYMTET_44118 [Cymbomonas tetramitiformis]
MSTLWDWPLTTGEISALKYYDENGDDLAFYEAGKWSDAAINAAGFAFIEFAPDTHAPYGTPSYFRLDNIVYGTQTVRYPTQYANTLAEAKRGEWQTPTGAQSRNPICNFGKAHYANNIWTGFGHASNGQCVDGPYVRDEGVLHGTVKLYGHKRGFSGDYWATNDVYDVNSLQSAQLTCPGSSIVHIFTEPVSPTAAVWGR